jgi:hypothetical protein
MHFPTPAISGPTNFPNLQSARCLAVALVAMAIFSLPSAMAQLNMKRLIFISFLLTPVHC